MSNRPTFPPFPEWPEPAVTGLVDVTDDPLDFTTVPRLRKRRDGWTVETQRAFIDALSQCGSVARSARAVGMSARSAYRLLEAGGADSFAEAWDQAIARGSSGCAATPCCVRSTAAGCRWCAAAASCAWNSA